MLIFTANDVLTKAYELTELVATVSSQISHLNTSLNANLALTGNGNLDTSATGVFGAMLDTYLVDMEAGLLGTQQNQVGYAIPLRLQNIERSCSLSHQSGSTEEAKVVAMIDSVNAVLAATPASRETCDEIICDVISAAEDALTSVLSAHES